MLALLGYETQHVRDARTALSVLLGGGRFALLFSDIVMPGGMSGMELARKVRQHFPRLPVLLATGATHAAADVAREGIALIAKPYRADALSDAIRQALAQAGAGVRETG
jgi:DNA-binding NtrC family response regulator